MYPVPTDRAPVERLPKKQEVGETVLNSNVRKPFHNFEEGSHIGEYGVPELSEDKLQPPNLSKLKESLEEIKTAKPVSTVTDSPVYVSNAMSNPNLPKFPDNQPVPTIDTQTLKEMIGEPVKTEKKVGVWDARPVLKTDTGVFTEKPVPTSSTDMRTTTGSVTRTVRNAIDTIKDKWRVLREDINKRQQESKDRVKPSFEKQLGIPEHKEEVKEVNTVDRMAEKLGEAATIVGSHPHTYTGLTPKEELQAQTIHTDNVAPDTRRVVIREVWIEPGKEPIESRIDRTADKIAAALHMDDKHSHTATEKRLDAKKDRVWLDADK